MRVPSALVQKRICGSMAGLDDAITISRPRSAADSQTSLIVSVLYCGFFRKGDSSGQGGNAEGKNAHRHVDCYDVYTVPSGIAEAGLNYHENRE